MLHSSLSFLLAFFTTLLLQRLAFQRPIVHPFVSDVVAGILGLAVHSFFFLCTGKPWFALFLTFLCFSLLALVTRAKQRALRDEPLLFSDITLVWQVVHFPGLYLPFLPWRPMLLSLAFLLPLGALICLMTPSVSFPPVATLVFLPCCFPFLCFCSGRAKKILASLLSVLGLSLNIRDAEQVGPLAAAVLQSLWHVILRGQNRGIRPSKDRPFAPLAFDETLLARVRQNRGTKCDVLLIQEESFCDPRVFSPRVPREILANFDALSSHGLLRELAVHAYGAYTMRTEYEVLSGIRPSFLGTDAFHPYWGCTRFPSWSLAWFFKALGYRTLCIHPFAASFFFRDKAFPQLGFDEFYALDAFSAPPTLGPYVSDACVAERILDELGRSGDPVFCFVITMENHGPWRGRFPASALTAYTRLGISEEVSAYLLHIAHFDAMLGMLGPALQRRSRDTLFALYGDHLPGLPTLVPKTSFETPCLLWKRDGLFLPSCQSVLEPAELGGLLLQALLGRDGDRDGEMGYS
ncbi:MAG: LTA synthase family protein [Desulfovibrio sp.]|nr:LTA synthase family protein [Desulfovibrio sp.]